MIKIIVVDDHNLIHNGIAALLLDLPNIEIIAKASTSEEALPIDSKGIERR